MKKIILSAIFQYHNHRWPTSEFLTCRVALGGHRDWSPAAPGETLRPEMSCVWVALLDSAFSEIRGPKRCPKPRPGLCTPWCWALEATNSPWLRSHPLETAHHYSTFANHNTHHFIQNVQKLLAAPPFSKKQKMGSGQCPNLLFGSGYVVKPSGLVPSAHPHRSDWKLSSTPKRGPWPSTKKTTPWMWGASSKRPFCSCATMPSAASPRVRTWEQIVVLSEGLDDRAYIILE